MSRDDDRFRFWLSPFGGVNRQTLRDWVHRFNERGPAGLRDIRSKGHPPRLSTDQLIGFAGIVETGPDCAVHGAALAMPFADTHAIQAHLDEIAMMVAKGAHAVLLLDRAGWHTTGTLVLPANISLIVLPSPGIHAD